MRRVTVCALGLVAIVMLGAQMIPGPPPAGFDPGMPVTLSGEISSVQWTGSTVQFSLTDEVAKPWLISVSAETVNGLDRLGLNRDTLRAGRMATIRAYPSLDGRCEPQCRAYANRLLLRDRPPNLVTDSRVRPENLRCYAATAGPTAPPPIAIQARPVPLETLFGPDVDSARYPPVWRGARITWAYELASHDPRFKDVVAVYPEGAMTAAGVHLAWAMMQSHLNQPPVLGDFRARDVSRNCLRSPTLAAGDIPNMPGYEFLRAMPVHRLTISGPEPTDGRWVGAWAKEGPSPETVVAMFRPEAKREGARPETAVLARAPFAAQMMSLTGNQHGDGVGAIVLGFHRPQGGPLVLVSLNPDRPYGDLGPQ